MKASQCGGDYNKKGRYYEVLFKAECLKRGLEVLSPECTHLPFDVAIYANGKFLKIQVKGTSTLQVRPGKRSVNRYYQFNTRNNNKVRYLDLGVDFIAGFIEPTNTWYIFPAGELTGSNIEVRLNATGRAALAKERWSLLDPTIPPPNLLDGVDNDTDRRSFGRIGVGADLITGAPGMNGNKVEKFG